MSENIVFNPTSAQHLGLSESRSGSASFRARSAHGLRPGEMRRSGLRHDAPRIPRVLLPSLGECLTECRLVPVAELDTSPEPDGRTGDRWTPVLIVSPKVHPESAGQPGFTPRLIRARRRFVRDPCAMGR